MSKRLKNLPNNFLIAVLEKERKVIFILALFMNFSSNWKWFEEFCLCSVELQLLKLWWSAFHWKMYLIFSGLYFSMGASWVISLNSIFRHCFGLLSPSIPKILVHYSTFLKFINLWRNFLSLINKIFHILGTKPCGKKSYKSLVSSLISFIRYFRVFPNLISFIILQSIWFYLYLKLFSSINRQNIRIFCFIVPNSRK